MTILELEKVKKTLVHNHPEYGEVVADADGAFLYWEEVEPLLTKLLNQERDRAVGIVEGVLSKLHGGGNGRRLLVQAIEAIKEGTL